MRTKKVNRYYCDFCKKAGCSAGHMRSHETHCTMNPNRVCRMCALIEDRARTANLSELIALLPIKEQFKTKTKNIEDSPYPGLEAAVEAVIPKLRDAAGDCPMCIWSALRQADLHHYTEFDLKSESSPILDEAARRRVRESRQVSYLEAK